MTLDEFIYTQSLTAVLCKNKANFSVRLYFSNITDILQEEMDFFPNIKQVFAREVLLCLNETPVVAARSICMPEDKYWLEILNCGNKSLGARLFDGKTNWQRSDFKIHNNYSLLEKRFDLPKEYITTRTSLFDHQTHRLLLAECFLPTLKSFGFE
ncbi:MAG: chorismate lyase [Neisseriaceae bacterium]|nr:chorismate lyase [Neisseriaceae bacterium]